MYGYEMQICYYNSVKYSARIKFHFYHLVTILWGNFFWFFLSLMGRFLQILLCIIDENVQMSSVVFQFKISKGMLESIKNLND
jgi:hypothetical protein